MKNIRETIINGKIETEKILEKTKDIRITDLADAVRKDQRDSNLIKQLMNVSGSTASQLGDYINCSRTYFNGKLNRDSFTIKDFLIIAYACGFRVELISKDDIKTLPIDLFAYLDLVNDGESERVKEVDRKYHERELLRSEYEAKKKELEDFKNKYGFED